MLRKNKATIAEIIALQNNSTIGTIEARNWLANQFPEFANSRKEEIDEYIENYGSELMNEEENDFASLDPGEDEL